MSVSVIHSAWVYLAATPLLYLFLTLLAFYIGRYLYKLSNGSQFLHPVIIAIALLIAFLYFTHTDYKTYFEGAQFLHFLLGPATVALAVPLYDHRERVRSMLVPICLGTSVGIITAIVTTIGIALLFGVEPRVILSMAPRSVTTPIAMGIAEKLGGIPSLAAAMVLITGVVGCMLAQGIFRLGKITDPTVQGYTMGLVAHGFGTAYCFTSIGAVAGAFSGLSMGITGLVTAFVLPPIAHLFGL